MDKIVGKTKHGEITIDELAQLQPGLGKLMDDMSTRFTYMYHSAKGGNCLLYTSPSPRDGLLSRMPSSA